MRIGLIGYGGIGRVHALAYRTLGFHYGLPADSITIHGVATTRKESAERAAAEIGCSIAVGDYHQLLRDPDIDAVDICVPNHLHEEVVIAAAQAGKHIYCEKPLAMDPAGGHRMVEAVESAGVTNQVSFNFRYYPAVLRARELIRDGIDGIITDVPAPMRAVVAELEQPARSCQNVTHVTATCIMTARLGNWSPRRRWGLRPMRRPAGTRSLSHFKYH